MLLTLAVAASLFLIGFPTTKAHEYHDCGSPEPSVLLQKQVRQAESDFFGMAVGDMTEEELAIVFSSLANDENSTEAFSGEARIGFHAGRLLVYRLVDIPIAYHILPNQNNGGIGKPSASKAQIDFLTAQTNAFYRIYNKRTRRTIPFATFVTDSINVHNVSIYSDCNSISSYAPQLIQSIEEYEFKMHAFICESNQWSGVASFPPSYPPSDPFHNMVRIEYRAVACYDDQGNFLCDLTNGHRISNTRWWRTRSAVLAHEFGHIFGLFHTFQGGCLIGDGVSDTPFESTSDAEGCPGLLPYDKNRNLYHFWKHNAVNPGSVESCGGNSSYVCSSGPSTCAACCTPPSPGADCIFYKSYAESVSEDETDFPACCNTPSPRDSCPQRGLDPKNNIMSYVPDWCMHEFTTGQMARMMALTFTFKPYIYCNYANRPSLLHCSNVPCGSNATSRYCK